MNPQKINSVRKLLLEGKTFSEIGLVLKISRNAVSGIVYRYIGNKKAKKRKKRKPLRFKELNQIKDKHIRYPDQRFLSDGYCRYIIGDPRKMTCCGEPTEKGKVYCDLHDSICNKTGE